MSFLWSIISNLQKAAKDLPIRWGSSGFIGDQIPSPIFLGLNSFLWSIIYPVLYSQIIFPKNPYIISKLLFFDNFWTLQPLQRERLFLTALLTLIELRIIFNFSSSFSFFRIESKRMHSFDQLDKKIITKQWFLIQKSKIDYLIKNILMITVLPLAFDYDSRLLSLIFVW